MATLIYNGIDSPTASGLLAYGQLPPPGGLASIPLAPGAFTPTLNTNLGLRNIPANTGYAGYSSYQYNLLGQTFTPVNPNFPTLNPLTGFSVSFNVAIADETSNPTRAGFSAIVLGSDGRGVELGFKNFTVDYIFAQAADLTNPAEAEQVTQNINAATTYTLNVLGDNYTLFANSSPILTGPLRAYNFNPLASTPQLPFNPYTATNFLFFGDNTDQGRATFTLGAISTNAFPVAIPDNYTIDEDTPFTFSVTANDTDADNDVLTPILASNPSEGTLTLNPDGTFTYIPAAHFSGTPTFLYQASDGTITSVTPATVEIAVNAVADAPLLAVTPTSGDPNTAIPLNISAELVDTDGSENLALRIANVPSSAVLNAGQNLGNGIWQLTLAELIGLTITPTTEENFVLAVTAIATETSNNDTASSSANLTVVVNPNQPIPIPEQPLTLIQNPNNIFSISDGTGQTQLQFTLLDNNSVSVNEVGVVAVDDNLGTINGIAPGTPGYVQAALSRATVISSVLANSPDNFDISDSTRILSYNANQHLLFYLVENSTTDTVLANLAAGQTPTNVVFALASANANGFNPLQASSQDDGVFTLRWDEQLGGGNQGFNDLVLNVQTTTEPPVLGTQLQGEVQGELIDLRNEVGSVQVEFVLNREAAFDNFCGLYQVVDQNGGIDVDGNGTADVLPGNPGYIQAAIQQRVLGLDLTVANQATAQIPGQLQGGFIYAPFIIVNGRPEALLDGNSTNDPAVYFPFLGANADGVDHLRLLGDNTFGFEDLPNGGDQDFNDIIMAVNFV